ncbi:SDR family NAD(P)-dependent oxidoreductase [Stakelama tenebrarum]|uniref:SDR family NAD(P)-dependent oxidoreductase n=1 Tax=Stakelama tenebrarum TaxID=2711215 RepID=A0A6G6Y500_9SPHN|nr:SDR family NAD(P)-dependent oxidoreductase [Sphingosinithalassobacter tenebrarum]QIG79798.1 SDR family NAD(P)-dependent oxidoreductase [Sphingosinithalassobacter tenebrarum]
MARIFITGSSGGLGLEAGGQLVAGGHDVVLHARNAERADAARGALAACQDVAIGDVSTLSGMHALADRIGALGDFDAVIHNVGVFEGRTRGETEDGFTPTFAVNVIAPYLLTATTPRPRRLIYLSSSMHRSGNPGLSDPMFEARRWDATQAYCDSKLYDTMLAFALAQRWPDRRINAVDPGWMPTNMGGKSASGDIPTGAATQVWLATADDADITGGYFLEKREERPAPSATDPDAQARLLAYLEELTGVSLPD